MENAAQVVNEILGQVTPPATEPPAANGGTPPPTPPPATPPVDDVSSKFAALAKKDKMLSRRAQDAAAQEARAKEMLANAEAKNKQFEDAKRLAQTNPTEAMKILGLTYEQLTQFILNQEKPTADMEIAALRRDLQTIREENERKEKEREQKAKDDLENNNKQIIDNFKNEIGDFLQSKPEEYELLNFLDSVGFISAKDVIFEGIRTAHAQHKKIATPKEAADIVQEYLTNQIDTLIQSVKFFKTKYGKTEPPAPPTEPTGATTTTKTITNDMSPGMGNQLTALTEEQRMKKAYDAMIAAEKPAGI